LCERLGQDGGLGAGRGLGGYLEVVDWLVLSGRAGDGDLWLLRSAFSSQVSLCNCGGAYLLACLVCPNVDLALFNSPDPEGQHSIDTCVERNCNGSVELCGFESELVVPVEGRRTNGKGSVAQSEAGIGKNM
jgi:hypothetical protein